MLVLEVFCMWTGEIILFILTLGTRKPKWGFEAEEPPTLAYFLHEIGTLIGIIFWFGLLIVVKLLVFK